ncbi:carboxypeptidase Y inhibitor [Fusarium falciforme]|uniref:Carboxypeptidase Y inhibitor n=1 Tax=Fusarium falciforme TaxID=195108 RepID=A0A9W8UZ77_9HYPO|nr:carboxypeptidase Y inhibitor [Fusarium falciforme]KAJ4186799.1 carboxypeptidase Y inhibitor [Fusarium falciforme]KAJ4229761.1 carboxypeptidase Y inhibitor [Fusarium falciforme]
MTDSSMTYVIVMTDPDAPSRQDPKWSEFCHWIRASYPALDSVTRRRRKDLVEYTPPAPPAGTGPHRYVFLAFIPANGTRKRLHLTTPSARVRWGSDTERTGVRDWANVNGLVPFAANFIYAENKRQ